MSEGISPISFLNFSCAFSLLEIFYFNFKDLNFLIGVLFLCFFFLQGKKSPKRLFLEVTN
ncbi:hypothetical protein BVAVS116_A0015 (plasmid) [Borreliella valaisiana VS116]|uniref:Uncharacterized protein n=1 Tax=Borreliella valaisiana VS116 TaxID=445987 RepID=C0R856_BORVA|nr:hypothetical protein BVAVS116_A0015 [Borreliella valaisiana VS116]